MSRGYTFVELVVAFGLLSMMIGIFFNLVPASQLASLRGENRLAASNLAQNLLEERRSQPFELLVVGSTEKTTVERGRTVLEVELTVLPVAGLDTKFVKQARVRVSWQEKTGPQELLYELRLFQQNR